MSTTDEVLWGSAAPYLPGSLVTAVAGRGRESPWIEPFDGTLLSADVTGFTSLSERLALHGRRGAEELTLLINSYFGGMLDIASAYGGECMKFGGDSLLCAFQGMDAALRAAGAAIAMQQSSRQFSERIEQERRLVRLALRIGLHSGRFWTASAGVRGKRLQFLVFGPESSRVTRTCSLATAGTVLASTPTFELIGDRARGRRLGDECTVLGLRGPAARPPPSARAIEALIGTDREELLSHVPPSVGQAIRRGLPPLPIESEHRRVTVAFINLLGIDRLLAAAGPDRVLGRTQEYVSLLVELCETYGGFLMGNDVDVDGIKFVVLFGAPVAGEDDPANALRFAARLTGRFRKLDSPLDHRIGINEGSVFAGDVGGARRHDYTVMGDEVNVAARLMATAPAGRAVVSKRTLDQAGRGFVTADLGSVAVKGKAAPVPVLELLGEATRSAGVSDGARAVVLGREAEAEQLRAASIAVEDGKHRTAVICGDVGVGKSAMARLVQDELRARGWTTYTGQCYAHRGHGPYGPWVEVLRDLLGVAGDDGQSVRDERVVGFISEAAPSAIEMASLLNPLLELTLPRSPAVAALDADASRTQLFRVVGQVLAGAAARKPVWLLLEDIDRADQGTLDLVDYIARELRPARLFLGLTTRDRGPLRPGLPAESSVTIPLGPLGDGDASTVVSTAAGRRLDRTLLLAILARAQGNPLFLEEIGRSLRQDGGPNAGAGSPGPGTGGLSVQVPDRLQALVMSRIDRLPPASARALRAAAVIGPVFDSEIVREVLEGGDEAALKSALVELESQELIESLAERQPATHFRFRHVVTQEVAYETIPFARRRSLHRQVGAYIESAHQADLDTVIEQLAHHFLAGGEGVKALACSLRAGRKAQRVHASADAISQYGRALSLISGDRGAGADRSYVLEWLGDSYQTSGRDAEAISAYSSALRWWARSTPARPGARLGLDREEAEPLSARDPGLRLKIAISCERASEYDRALDWLKSVTRTSGRLRAALGARVQVVTSVALFRKGHYSRAIPHARRGLKMAGRAGRLSLRAYAHDMLASSFLELGRPRVALRHRLQALAIYETEQNIPGLLVTSNNLGTAYQVLGQLDNALAHYRRAVEFSNRIGHATAAAVVSNNIGEVLLVEGRASEALQYFREVVDTCERTGEPRAAAGLALVNTARALQRLGRLDEAEEALNRGFGYLKDARARGLLADALIQRADLLLARGELDASEVALAKALSESRRVGSDLLTARALRIAGQVAVARGRPGDAERHLSESLGLFRRSGSDHEAAITLLRLADVHSRGPARSDLRRRERSLRRAVSLLKRSGAEKALVEELEPVLRGAQRAG